MTTPNTFVLWNSAGLRASTASTSQKFSFFDSQFKNANFSIAAFVETHHKDHKDFTQDFFQYHQTHTIVHSPVKDETHSGIIILISKEYEILDETETLPGRLFTVKLKKRGIETILTVFYGHQWGKMNKEDILKILTTFEYLHDSQENNIILGDFNFVDLDVDKGKKMNGKDKMIKPIWDQFLAKSAMVDPFRMQYPTRKLYSFTSAQGKSRGDRIYVSDHNVASIRNIRYINTPFLTAHKMMTFDLQ